MGLRRFCEDNHNLSIVVATDAALMPKGARLLPWKRQTWPDSTYAKFDMILALKDTLEPGHVVLMDADTHLRGRPWRTEFFTRGPIVAKEHRLNRHDREEKLRSPFEQNPESPAFIPLDKHTTQDYVTGSLMGGETQQFIKAGEELRDCIHKDLARGHVNEWHDETHWNRYVYEHPETFIIRHPEFDHMFVDGDKGDLDTDYLRGQ